LDYSAVGQRDLRAGGDVAAGLDDAVVSQRDADAGVRADQATLADPYDLLAAAAEGAHDGRPAADIRPVADDHARDDATLHHRGSQRAGIEVDEALVHHRRAGR